VIEKEAVDGPETRVACLTRGVLRAGQSRRSMKQMMTLLTGLSLDAPQARTREERSATAMPDRDYYEVRVGSRTPRPMRSRRPPQVGPKASYDVNTGESGQGKLKEDAQQA